MLFRHVEAEEKPNKKSKKSGAKGSVVIERVNTIELCISRFLSEQIYFTQTRRSASKHAVHFSKDTWNQIKIRGNILKCALHERNYSAPKFGEDKEILHRNAAWDLAKHIYNFKNSEKATFYGNVGTHFTRPKRHEFNANSGA